MITLAKLLDVESIHNLSVRAKLHMREIGINQWDTDYPYESTFRNDVLLDALYIYKRETKILGSISLLPENDKPYKELVWSKNNSLVIHRLIVDPNTQKQGIGKALFDFTIRYAKDNNYESIKVDTHPDNYRMQSLIKKIGFIEVGYLTSINRLAYELVL